MEKFGQMVFITGIQSHKNSCVFSFKVKAA